MELSTYDPKCHGEYGDLAALFERTFAAAEGADEGEVIGKLVTELLASTPPADRHVFVALAEQALIGGIIFSRLWFTQDSRTCFILSPVAVATTRQRTGIGQQLITYGLAAIRTQGADLAFTYGDPAYYGKVGFRQISETDAPAPLKLSHPHGWLAQSLDGQDLTSLKGPSRCVDALAKPELW